MITGLSGFDNECPRFSRIFCIRTIWPGEKKKKKNLKMGFDLFILVQKKGSYSISPLDEICPCLPCICARTPRRSLASFQTRNDSRMKAPTWGIQKMFPEYRPSQKTQKRKGWESTVILWDCDIFKRECPILFNCGTKPLQKYLFWQTAF